ncbi:glycosyltransferase family 4 protein [Merismopedia glauca]|uniref:Glycosyltransferase family 1 protein n=1 Tax=Merismopedia glauca CCAP 1448/3 TaxID=1296344 RepID=A0A2T1C5Y9_9CYAN|nr:glycosyltransferase family 4 protein [Merismopedia glauca]PSB03547.1 glycosyltransferase family 1 protein [Merismopedia glauca CCAP 1448/3]
MKKLLIVTTISETLTSFLLPFAHHFKDRGWRVDAMSQGVSQSPECLAAFDQVWEIKWSRNPLDPRNLIIAPSVIQQVVKQEEYDLVHVHTPVAAFVTRYALRNFRKSGKLRVIYTAHGFHFYPGGNPFKNQIFLTLEKIAGNWTDDLVVINRTDESAAKHYQIIAPNSLHYMPGIGVDLQYYSQDSISSEAVDRVYQELAITSENPLFLVIAEFIPRKHHQDVLQALAKLGRSHVHLALAGDGSLLPQMQSLAVELGIKNQVHFLGYRQDIPTLIKAATATILVSEQEGLPRSIMESLAIGTPVIGSDIRGIKDLLKEGCGILVKVGDVEDLTKAIARIIDRPSETKAMSEKGINCISKYDLQQIIHLHEKLY